MYDQLYPVMGDEINDRIGKILEKLGGTSGGGGSSVGIVVSPQSVTPHNTLLGASASQVIPIGAKGWSVSIITGTATVGSASLLPAGFSDSDPNTLLATIIVTTDSASSAYVRWNT